MTLWIDAQLSPALATWLAENFSSCSPYSLRDLGLRDADDEVIFYAAHAAQDVVITKGADFPALLRRHGPPPQVL